MWYGRRLAHAALLAVGLSQAAHAGQTNNSAVVELSINRAYGNYVFVRLGNPPSSPAGCSTNGYWHYTLSLDGVAGSELYAMLMTAKASGTNVTAVGTGVCSQYGSIESLAAVSVL
jgi:hypothetical protein